MSGAVGTWGCLGMAPLLVYERRLGPRNQFELVAPVAFSERTPGDWTGGVGDLALAFKRAVAHSAERGTIVSVAAELVVPTRQHSRSVSDCRRMLSFRL